MNRTEFIDQLSRLLCDLPENERQDALDYYNDYFDDAGPENEGMIIQELGSPGKVAAGIRASYRGDYKDQGQYTDNGYRDHETSQENPISAVSSESGQKGRDNNRNSRKQNQENREQKQDNREQKQEHRYDKKGRRGVGGWFLIILILIMFLPITFGITGGAFGILAGLCAAVLALFLSGFILAGCGIAFVVKGMMLAVTSLGSGLLLTGIGLILFAAGLALTVFFVWLLFKILPKVFRWLISRLSRIFHHGRGRDEGGASS